uniref:Sulfite exporter TauE/SafE family protein n=1 Tax=Panagrellus redivivus TaxID=6233 RepID=A0A7E4VWZ9_PANRE
MESKDGRLRLELPPMVRCPAEKRQNMGFFRKYFLQGQELVKPLRGVRHESETISKPSFVERNRKYIGLLIPFLFMHTVWWTLAFRYNILERFKTYYEMPITMIFGATVAGMTSEGGGAVAFPVMTLLLHFDARQARDFSLMIQSCGMTSAAFTIMWMGIVIEWSAIILCTLGSTVGIIIGLTFVDELLTGAEKKMLFVAIWASFALSLWLLNHEQHRRTYDRIQNMTIGKGSVLLATGFVGGLCSAFAGSGVDICSFSMLTLLFRVSEKTATPTSVVLMAANTCVGFFWRQLIMTAVDPVVWMHFSTSVPVVVLCAPLGSLLASHFHRLVLASFVYILEALALIGFLATRPDLHLVLIGAGIICCSLGFFLGISRIGRYYDDIYAPAIAMPSPPAPYKTRTVVHFSDVHDFRGK